MRAERFPCIYAVWTAVLLLSLSGGSSSTPHQGETTKVLQFVAAADGKSFFADDREWMNWYEADEFCKGFRMKLASITSQAQFDALAAGQFGGDYYTSGREAREIRQFSWNDTNQAPPAEFEYRNLSTDFQVCLIFKKGSNVPGGSYFIGRGCREEVAKPMCESG